MSQYGMYDLTGVRDDEPEPCPRAWDKNRNTWNDDWKQFLYEHEIEYYQKKYDAMKYRLSDKLRDPKKLIEIAEAGANDRERPWAWLVQPPNSFLTKLVPRKV